MKKYEVRWKELRYMNCSAEVEAETVEEAIKLAQDYEFDVYEVTGDCFEIYPGQAIEIEDQGYGSISDMGLTVYQKCFFRWRMV